MNDIIDDLIHHAVFAPLSPDEVRMNLKYAAWKEENDQHLIKQLRFLADQLEKYDQERA